MVFPKLGWSCVLARDGHPTSEDRSPGVAPLFPPAAPPGWPEQQDRWTARTGWNPAPTPSAGPRGTPRWEGLGWPHPSTTEHLPSCGSLQQALRGLSWTSGNCLGYSHPPSVRKQLGGGLQGSWVCAAAAFCMVWLATWNDVFSSPAKPSTP